MYEERVEATRTIWVAKCSGCGDSIEHTEKRAKERFCVPCQKWVPYVEVSYTGPKLRGKSA
jgi:hypothetical protein